MTATTRLAVLATLLCGTAGPAACTRTAGAPGQVERDEGTTAPVVTTPGTPEAPAAPPQPVPTAAVPPPAASPVAFRFVAWGDTKVGSSADAGAVLQALSREARALTPPASFTLYLGDLEESGFDDGGQADDWESRLNGGSANGTSLMTFVTRGNHDAVDASSTGSWQSYFDFAGVAGSVGATSYTALDPQLTYSFDYGNSHFVSLDAPGDFPATVTARQLSWLDQDLAAAEARGLTHAFLYWHGPIYSVSTAHPLDNQRPEPAIADLVAIVGRHPIVSAVLNGHEHLLAYSHIGPARFPTLAFAHEFEEFTVGTGGASFHDPVPGRGDAVLPYVAAFATIDVSGRSFTVRWYGQGNPASQGTFTFTKP